MSKAKQRKVAVSDSAQKKRRAMIRRMQQPNKEPAAVKKSEVLKSYNGVKRRK